MRVNVRELAPGEPFRAPFVERLTLEADGQTTEAEAQGEVRIDRSAQGGRLHGRIEAQTHLVCSRCLAPFPGRLTVELEEEFTTGPGPRVHGGELGPQDFVQWVGPGHELDVTEIVRQHLQIALPMAPLHRPDCRGLCPVCGANWNERSCEHQPSLAGPS